MGLGGVLVCGLIITYVVKIASPSYHQISENGMNKLLRNTGMRPLKRNFQCPELPHLFPIQRKSPRIKKGKIASGAPAVLTLENSVHNNPESLSSSQSISHYCPPIRARILTQANGFTGVKAAALIVSLISFFYDYLERSIWML